MSTLGPRIYVFYAGLLHSEWFIFPRMQHIGTEIFQGCYVWDASERYGPPSWYRGDNTPFPTDQVPPELRAMALLLT